MLRYKMARMYELDFNDAENTKAYLRAVETAENLAVNFHALIGPTTPQNISTNVETVEYLRAEHAKSLKPFILTYLPEEISMTHADNEVGAAIFAVREIHRQIFGPLFEELVGSDESELDDTGAARQDRLYAQFRTKLYGMNRNRAAGKIAKATTKMLANDMKILRIAVQDKR